MRQPFYTPAAARRVFAVLLSVPLGLCLAAAPAAAQSAPSPAYTWGNVAIGGGGFVSGIVTTKARKDLVYARTDVGGAYRWDAAGQRWVPLMDWVSEDDRGLMGVESLAVDPGNPENLYILAGTSYFSGGKTAILRSSDRGKTFRVVDVTAQFRAHGNGMGRQTGERLAVDPGDGRILLCGTRAHGLFRSADSGETWTRTALDVTTTPSGNGVNIVVFDPSTSDKAAGGATRTLIVGVSRTGANLYRSDDGGRTFAAIAGAPSDLMPQRAVLAGDRTLYVTYANGAGPHPTQSEAMNRGQIWKYDLASGAWTDVTPAGVKHPFGGITVDPTNPRRLLASTINTYQPQGGAYGDRIFLTADGGRSWTDVIARGFKMDPNGITWIEGHAIHWAGSIEFDPFNPKRAYVTSGNGVFTTDDIDAVPCVWKFDVRGLEETVPQSLVSLPGGPTLSVISDYDGFRHTDVHAYVPTHHPRMGTTQGLAYAWARPDKIVRAGDKMFVSTDRGVTWTRTAAMNGRYGIVALSADGAALLHAPERSKTTYRSTDDGATWAPVAGIDFEAAPVSDPVDPRTFYIYDKVAGALLRSADAGASFVRAGALPVGGARRIQVVPGYRGHLWVALAGGGLARSVDGGGTFTRLGGVEACAAVGTGKAAPGADYPTLFIWGTVGGVTGIHRSTDQGRTWVRINDDAHQYGGPGNGEFVLGDVNHFGRVYMSTVGRGIVLGEPATP